MSFQSGSVVDRDPRHAIAGLSMKGGQKENFYLSLIQYFPHYGRWSLTKLSPVKDYPVGGDDTLQSWVKEHDLRHLVLDFPLTQPACLDCLIDCPGSDLCSDENILKLKKEIKDTLDADIKLYEKDPKRYEYKRLNMKLVRNKDSERPSDVISKSFKRRLKKGITPYWHRSIDLWIWKEYYDSFFHFFKTSYDSLGGSSLMLMNRFEYIKKHLPKTVKLWESDTRFVMLELLAGDIIRERYLRGLNQLDEAHISRKSIIHNIEKNLSVFIYEHDQETLETNPKAFDSFILALAGICQQKGWVKDMPSWVKDQDSFIVPRFS